jgi:hypothetical protein
MEKEMSIYIRAFRPETPVEVADRIRDMAEIDEMTYFTALHHKKPEIVEVDVDDTTATRFVIFCSTNPVEASSFGGTDEEWDERDIGFFKSYEKAEDFVY